MNRILNIVDLQPLHPTEEYAKKYIHHLTPIRDKYPDLHGRLSGKFYDDVSFFSPNMLFGRFTDESKTSSVVVPAHNEYLEEYISCMNSAVPNDTEESMKIVMERQRQYDVYQAVKDPAIGLFDTYFGKGWSTDYVHNFLFPLSEFPSTVKELK